IPPPPSYTLFPYTTLFRSPRYISTPALTGHFMTAVNLHHRVTGTGQPLVMLHGLFGSQENLGAISRLLAEQYQIHGLDLRNHGRSEEHTSELQSRENLVCR